MISENKSCNPSRAMTSCHRFQVSSAKRSSISQSRTRLWKARFTDDTSNRVFCWPRLSNEPQKPRHLNASALATSNAGFLASVSSPEGVVRAPTSGRGFKWNSQIGQTLTRQVQQMYAKGPQITLTARGLLHFS